MQNKPKYILIHCTDYSYRLLSDQFVACNGWHKDRDFPLSSLGLYIGYHRLITGDLNYKCREDSDVGAHCNSSKNGLSMNYQSLGVCIGFDGDIEMPTPVQYSLLQKQIWAWQDMYNITNENVFFHRTFSIDKTCPGSLLTDQWRKDLLYRALPITLTTLAPDKSNACAVQEKVISNQKVEIATYKKWLSWFGINI